VRYFSVLNCVEIFYDYFLWAKYTIGLKNG
jgi:hypothetical protein